MYRYYISYHYILIIAEQEILQRRNPVRLDCFPSPLSPLCSITFYLLLHSSVYTTLFPPGAFRDRLWTFGAFYHAVVTVGTPVSRPDPSRPLPLSTEWPTVLLRENNISCNCGVPEQRQRSRRCDWHRVTNTLNSDNRKWMQGALLKAQHTACGTLKLTRLSRWHVLIAPLWPQFHLWFFAFGLNPMLLAHWSLKDRPCRCWSCPLNTNGSG